MDDNRCSCTCILCGGWVAVSLETISCNKCPYISIAPCKRKWFRIQRRQVVLLHWNQASKLGVPGTQFPIDGISAHKPLELLRIKLQNLNLIARSYNERAFNPASVRQPSRLWVNMLHEYTRSDNITVINKLYKTVCVLWNIPLKHNHASIVPD